MRYTVKAGDVPIDEIGCLLRLQIRPAQPHGVHQRRARILREVFPAHLAEAQRVDGVRHRLPIQRGDDAAHCEAAHNRLVQRLLRVAGEG
jgi:hypothetical protein